MSRAKDAYCRACYADHHISKCPHGTKKNDPAFVAKMRRRTAIEWALTEVLKEFDPLERARIVYWSVHNAAKNTGEPLTEAVKHRLWTAISAQEDQIEAMDARVLAEEEEHEFEIAVRVAERKAERERKKVKAPAPVLRLVRA